MSKTAPVEASLTGTATFRERLALPANAVFEATLEDVSRADAPAEPLGSTCMETPDNPPYRFTATAATPSARRLRGLYSYMADAGMFVECETGQRLPVVQEAENAVLEAAYSAARPTPGAALLAIVDGRIENRQPMEGPVRPMLVVERFVSISPGGCSGARSTASLENTYWKLSRLGAQPVIVADKQREAHFVLQAETKRVSGSGGCNRIMGSYALDGDKLSFSQMAGTMMACSEGMEMERAFHAALQQVARWRIEGERLELFDAAGLSVASFASRYMK